MMEGVWLPQARYRGYSPLRETPREYFECLEDCGDCQDELFLLPERALDMDSYTLREDLSSIVPSYRWKISSHLNQVTVVARILKSFFWRRLAQLAD